MIYARSELFPELSAEQFDIIDIIYIIDIIEVNIPFDLNIIINLIITSLMLKRNNNPI